MDSSEQEEVLPNEEEKEEISGDDPLEDVITEGEEPAEEEEILPATASADDLVYGDLTYRVNNNKVTITGYKGSGTSAVIPAKIGSYEVKEIADRAFSGCGTLESISLPEGLERIGYQFIANTGITSLTVPSTVTASGISWYEGATAGAGELQKVVFAEGMKRIPDYFCSSDSKNYAIKEIVLPSSITDIGSEAFRDCAGVERVDFGKELKSIGSEAFYQCENLREISFEENPKQVVGTDGKKRLYALDIGTSAFGQCTGLTTIKRKESDTQTGSFTNHSTGKNQLYFFK